MTARREWPNAAIAARDKSALKAFAGMKSLKPIIKGERMSDEEMLRRIAQSYNNLHQIVRLMEAVGTRMTDPTQEMDEDDLGG